MIVNHNVSAEFAHRMLMQTERKLNTSIEKLASGLRINSAGDDPSGLAVSETLRSQIRGLKQAQRNAVNGVSFIQTAEGSLQEVHAILHRVRELAVQSANAVYTEQDRELMQIEVSQLLQEIDRVAEATEFNRYKILTGSQPSFRFHVGPNQEQEISVKVQTMSSRAIGVSGLTMETPESADEAIGKVDQAVNTVSRQRALLGAVQNRLEHVISHLAVAEQNFQAAESFIRDADMASEMVDFMRLKVLEEARTAMLLHAGLRSESVLKLFE
jgi:flagellin